MTGKHNDKKLRGEAHVCSGGWGRRRRGSGERLSAQIARQAALGPVAAVAGNGQSELFAALSGEVAAVRDDAAAAAVRA